MQLETVGFDHEDVLLMSTPSELPLRLNGNPAPRLTRLRIGDQIQFADRELLHVTVYQRPQVGKPDAELVGKECPVCRVPFEPETRVYVCPHCDIPMHDEPLHNEGESDGTATIDADGPREADAGDTALEAEDEDAEGEDAEGIDLEADGPLQCARLSDVCPFCQRPIRMEEGYLYVPAS